MGRPAVIITRGDQQTSVDQIQLLLTSAKAYRLQMLALSKTAANFGYALEKIAHSKAAVRDPSNSDTLYKQFEIPLLQHLDTHKANIEASEAQYERSMRDMSQKIKETEATSLQNGRKRQRDLFQFRQALTTLTMQVDELERIKLGYYFSNLESEQANLQLILQKTSTIVRAEVDIYERIANKGLNDAILEPMTTQGPDPYCIYPTTDEFSSIFSILPPTPIIPTSGAGTTGTTTPQPDAIMSNFYGYHEHNTFSTARNLTNAATRDRHLFGDASSVESKEVVIKKTTTTTTTTTTTASVANDVQSTQELSAKTSKDTASSTNEPSETVKLDRDQDVETLKESDGRSPSPEGIVMALEVQKDDDEKDELTGESAGLETKSTEQDSQSSDYEMVDPQPSGASEEAGENQNASTTDDSNGVDLRSGQQHHRRPDTAPSKEDIPHHPASSPSEPASSVRSYSLRSYSGSRSHLLLASTPESPPVRGTIHIGQDSELLNNRDFSFSYEPSEFMEQRSLHSQLNLSRHGAHSGLQAFGGFDEMEEDHGGFGATPPTTTNTSLHQQAPLNSSPQHQHQHLHSRNHSQHLHTLRHTSSDGQLSHSSSSNLSSIGSNSSGSLHHRRSTGRIKTELETSSLSAAMFDGEEPYLPTMTNNRQVEMRRGFDDGMPAFFADEVEEDSQERQTQARPSSLRQSFGWSAYGSIGSGQVSRRHSVDSMVRMADGSCKDMSTTNVEEIVV
ncbi:hypothetical protein BGZ54_008199 [Gamsiella multidivaricata]|nr:hypothetical protein BGZ54_008199 [Gamsiella multidivaricata]